MFSTQDVQDIFRSLPPPQDGILPQFVVSAGGSGLVSGKSLVRQFERLMTAASERQLITSISQNLDVTPDIVIQLIQKSPHLALLSDTELAVIPKSQRDFIHQQLQGLLTKSLVDLQKLVQQNGVSKRSVEALVEFVEFDVEEVDDHLLGAEYEKTLSAAIRSHLDRALEAVQPIGLTSANLDGQPPTWLIQRTLQKLQQSVELNSRFYFNQEDDSIQCMPKGAATRARDAAVNRLESGETHFLDLREFSTEFSHLHPSHTDALQFFDGSPHVCVVADYAVSNKWMSGLEDETVRNLEEDGYADCDAKVGISTSPTLKNGIVEYLIRSTMESYPAKTINAQKFLLTSSKYSLERDVLFDFAKAQATHQWQNTTETPTKDAKFQISDLLGAIPPEQRLLRAVAQENTMQPLLLERFSTEVSNLELQNEAEFSTYWKDRVASRINAYCASLQAIEDQKLHSQLAELLAAYLQKDLIPDALAKAQSQGLVRSKKTRKNVQKLDTALKAGAKDLPSVQSSLEKFGKKQDIPAVDEAALVEAKNTMVGDMTRRLQKPKTDGPLLFLTLIVVLFAKQCPGVVYATGKFAPKLLKQLKATLKAEEYDQLEKWKELAKTGALSSGDKEGMRQMVVPG